PGGWQPGRFPTADALGGQIKPATIGAPVRCSHCRRLRPGAVVAPRVMASWTWPLPLRPLALAIQVLAIQVLAIQGLAIRVLVIPVMVASAVRALRASLE